MFQKTENGQLVRYVVDGHEFDDPESDELGDGKYAPFRIFDVEGQLHLATEHADRASAEAVAASLNEGSSK